MYLRNWIYVRASMLPIAVTLFHVSQRMRASSVVCGNKCQLLHAPIHMSQWPGQRASAAEFVWRSSFCHDATNIHEQSLLWWLLEREVLFFLVRKKVWGWLRRVCLRREPSCQPPDSGQDVERRVSETKKNPKSQRIKHSSA